MLEWDALEDFCNTCRRCRLNENRNKVVFGKGSKTASLMFVGEGPGRDEDAAGIPFVGKAGQLLDRILEAAGIDENDVYIGNIVKCRPPGNRIPAPDEARACLPYLRNQVYLIKPKIIVCLGATAAKYIIDDGIRITRDRGQWHQRKGYWLMATYHPAALLRDEAKKRPAWEDFKSIAAKLKGLKVG
ncbi:MAG: uracil-DNA glycosylase [Clostridia bacterium]|jgi:uracil-DNA glycosylase family 4|nr:uracil-DNA glycosylase [Clostridiales bacterium]